MFKNLVLDLETALHEVEVPESWSTTELEIEHVSLPTDINVNSFSAFDRTEPETANSTQVLDCRS